MKRQMWIDTDTASDDAVALIIALRHPDIEVRGISVVAGNVPLEMGVQNALYTAELCASTVPIYVGAAQPLVRTLDTAQFVHGVDGMGDIGLPLFGRVPTPGDAIDEIISAAHRHAHELRERVAGHDQRDLQLRRAERLGVVRQVGDDDAEPHEVEHHREEDDEERLHVASGRRRSASWKRPLEA